MAGIDIEKAAERPKEVTQDGRTVKTHSLSEQIQADEYLKKKNAAKRNPFRAVRISKPVGNGAW